MPVSCSIMPWDAPDTQRATPFATCGPVSVSFFCGPSNGLRGEHGTPRLSGVSGLAEFMIIAQCDKQKMRDVVQAMYESSTDHPRLRRLIPHPMPKHCRGMPARTGCCWGHISCPFAP